MTSRRARIIPEPDPSTFEGRLRIALNGRSPDAVARAAGISRITVRKMLREGRKRGAYCDTIAAVADVCGVSRGWLAFGEGKREVERVEGG